MTATALPTQAPTQAGDDRGRPEHWRLVIVLTAIYAYAFVDRVILALLVDPIKARLDASDVQMSLMLGLAFAAFYSVVSIPAGHYVDRVNRRKLIAMASVAWATMTIVCGMAGNFAQLFVGRMGVGLAEALVAPAAFSLIRDAVPARSRGLAFSIFGMSPMIGGATSLIGGAALLRLIAAGTFAGAPLLGTLAPWQCTLVLVGLCGLPLSLSLLLIAEPPRAAPGSRSDDDGLITGLGTAWSFMKDHAAQFAPLVLFATFGAMLAFSTGAWLPTAFARRWHLSPQQVGPVLGLLTLAGGIPGLVFTGAVMNAIVRRGGDIRRYGALAAVLAAAGIASAVIAPTAVLGYAFAGIGMFFVGSSYAVGAATLSEATPVAVMGRVSAIYLLLQNLVGQALGPFIVAMMAAHVFSGPYALPDGFAVSMLLYAFATAVSAIALGRAIGRRGIS